MISAVDRDQEKVLVNRTKGQIKAAPELTPESVLDENYWEIVGTGKPVGGESHQM